MSERHCDVTIVGGGVIGCFAALHLARCGCRVTLVERDSLGSGASHGNCGYICPSHVHPLCGPGAVLSGLRTMAKFGGALSIPPRWDPTLWRWLTRFTRHCNANDFQYASAARHTLLQSSRNQYQQIADQDAQRIGWRPSGLLTVYRSQRDFDAFRSTASQLRDDYGVQVDPYPGSKLREVAPELRDDLAGAYHFPGDAHISPTKLLAYLRDQLDQAGVTVREQTPVVGLHSQGGRLVALQTDHGDALAADQFVFATGAEAGRWGKQLGCQIPIIPGKGFSVTISNVSEMPTMPMIFEDDHVAITHFGDSFRIGSTMQLTGFDRSVPQHRIELLKRAAARHLQSPLPSGSESKWSGWRPMMPDGLPMIGKTPRMDNAYVAAGNGMIGIATAPATGQLLAELVAGRTPHLDPEPFRVDRF